MKNNGSVSNTRINLKPESVLVSKTDLRGIITYCNAEFVEASGFTEKELLGKSHNIVRHPDMPKEAFSDLWNHLKNDRPWSGLVKNRAKSGDYYWVRANITPIYQNGDIVEYMSVRTMPSQHEVDQAESLYRDVRESGKALHQKSLSQALTATRLPWPLLLTFVSLSGLSFLAWQAVSNNAPLSSILVIAVSGITSFGAFISSRNRQKRSINQLLKTLKSITQGKYFSWDNQTPLPRHQVLHDAVKSLQIRQGYESMSTRDIATRALRVQTALDSVETNVMIADEHHNIIYLNNSVQRMFSRAENDIQRVIPDFRADQLIGSNIDRFHKQPSHQHDLLSRLTSPHHAEIKIGRRSLGFIAIPVISESGQRTGTVVEWQDRTEEVAIEHEIHSIVERAQLGDLDKRIDLHNKQGFFLRLGEEVNALLGINEQVISQTLHTLESMSEGDLTQAMQGDYKGSFGQLKDKLNETLDHLRNTVGTISQTTLAVNSGVREIALGNEDLAERTNQQAVALEEAASSMEEISGSMQQTAKNAVQAKDIANKAKEIAERGGETVAEAISAMVEVENVSQEIAEISDVIDGIAFQTNLLALNAAVEAAHAGDEGRGFAVVASEVRILAQSCAESAQSIQGLIKNSAIKIQEGTEKVRASESTLKNIINASEEVRDVVHQISNASLEQATGVKEINHRLVELDSATQENAALVQETATSGSVLGGQSLELEELVQFFTISEPGIVDNDALNRNREPVY